MKRRLLTALAALALMATNACTGISAREEVLMPAMALTWPNIVSSSIEPGLSRIEDNNEVARLRGEVTAMEEALASGDRSRVFLVDWASLQQVAFEGIVFRFSQGELQLLAVDSLNERIANFNDSYLKLLAR